MKMKMKCLVAVLGLLLSTRASADQSGAAGTTFQPVDLNRPGALEQLKLDRPTHHDAIAEVLRVAEKVPCNNWELESIKVRFDIRGMVCNFVLMTSYPPKRHLSFQLEETRYVATVTLKDSYGRVVPAKDGE